MISTNQIIQDVLQLSLQKHDKYEHLEKLAKELEAENIALEFNKENIDRVLLDVFTNWNQKKLIFDYLVECFGRLGKFSSSSNQNEDILKLKELILSYSGLVLSMPDMFSQQTEIENLGGKQLLLKINDLPSGFLDCLFSAVDEDTLITILNDFFTELSTKMSQQTILSSYISFYNALGVILSLIKVQDVLLKVNNIVPNGMHPKEIQKSSVFGPFFSLSPLDAQVSESLFKGATQMMRTDLESSFYSCRSSLKLITENMHQILLSLIKSSPGNKELILQFFAIVSLLNEKRAHLQVDEEHVSSHGMILNINNVLLLFCQPFLNPAKMPLVSPYYYWQSNRIDISKHTALKATDKIQIEEFVKRIKENSSSSNGVNFVSECFYLTLEYLHIGYCKLANEYIETLKHMRECNDALKKMKESEMQWRNTPLAMQNDFYLKRLQAQMDKLMTEKLAMDVYLMDEAVLSSVMAFLSFEMEWIISLVEKEEECLKYYPEWIVDDLVEFNLFLCRIMPKWFLNNHPYTLMKFIIYFLRDASLAKNPYLRSKMVEIVFYFTLEEGRIPFESFPIVVESIVSSLMNFYIEVESTGARSQFYDKFNIRYHISQILKYLWDNPAQKEKVKLQSQNINHFVQFMNLLINDITFLLDESLGKLADIHNMQIEMSDPSFATKPINYQREKEASLNLAERQCSSYMMLGNESINMLKYLSEEIKRPFYRPEIIDRLSAMLDYNLVQLVGPKCTELKVKNPEKYSFDPKRLLSDIIRIYLNLKSEEFVDSIAKDSRSYSRATFEKALSIIRKNLLVGPKECERFAELIELIESRVKNVTEMEQDLGEIPDELMDPLMFTLMRDPVKLMTSGVTVDRSTITAHLLNDKTDPFNRMPLTKDLIVDDSEMKAKVEEFLKSRKVQ